MSFVIVMFSIFLVFVVVSGTNGVIYEEYEIKEFLKKYQYSILINNDTIQKTVLYKLSGEETGIDGNGIISFIMYYWLLYIARFSSDKEQALKKVFEKSNKSKKEIKNN